MRKLIYSTAIITLVGFFLWPACRKNDNPPNPPVDIKINASVKGRVIDETGNPVSNATVKSGSFSTTTDVNGSFYFSNIQLSKEAGFVSVEKSGYFKTGRTFLTHQNVDNYVNIQLIRRVNKGNFQSAAGGNITIQPGTTVGFPVNGLVNASTNSPYSGTVNVFGSYLDPTNPQLSAIMPGNLMALNSSDQSRLLQTYGMIAVELEGAAGEKLQLANGKLATLTATIPAAMLANAPATIPLWYFDDITGLWKEEGSATKQGSNYVGQVSHFSFWNYDVPANFITLTMTLQNQAG